MTEGGRESATAGAAFAGQSGGEAGGEAGNPSDIGAAGQAPRDLRELPYPPSPYPVENPDSDAKAMLGKILFWDEQLSGDNTVAAARVTARTQVAMIRARILPVAAQAGTDAFSAR